MKAIIMLMILAVAFIMPSVATAQNDNPYYYYCIDNATLQIEYTLDSNISGSMKTYVLENRSLPCIYGCDSVTLQCNPAPYQQTVVVALVVAMMVIVGGIIIKKA